MTFSELNMNVRITESNAANTRLTHIVMTNGATANVPAISDDMQSALFKTGIKKKPIEGEVMNIEQREQTIIRIITGAMSPFASFVERAYADMIESRATNTSTVDITTSSSPI